MVRAAAEEISPLVLNLGTRRRRVSSFTPWSRYPEGKELPAPWNRRLGEHQCRSGRFGEEKNVFLLPAIEPLFLHGLAHSLVSVPTELLQIQAVKPGPYYAFRQGSIQRGNDQVVGESEWGGLCCHRIFLRNPSSVEQRLRNADLT